MATSSIVASFNIKDRKAVEAFAKALDQSAKEHNECLHHLPVTYNRQGEDLRTACTKEENN